MGDVDGNGVPELAVGASGYTSTATASPGAVFILDLVDLCPTPVPTPVPTLNPTPLPTGAPTPLPSAVPTLVPTPRSGPIPLLLFLLLPVCDADSMTHRVACRQAFAIADCLADSSAYLLTDSRVGGLASSLLQHP